MNAAARVIEFALQHAPEVALHRRTQLYRDLAELTPDESRARDLNTLANELEAIEARHEQLVMDFKRRAGG